MKLKINILLLLLSPLFAVSQTLSETASFEKAVTLAHQINKPLLVIVKQIPSPNSKMPTNVVPFSDVVRRMKNNFVVFETDRTDKALAKLLSIYKIKIFPAFLFMHNGTDIFYSEFGYSTNQNKYLTMLEKGISLSKAESITDLEKDYLNDRTNNSKLTKLIQSRIDKGLTDNAELIEQFANNLRLGDLNDYQTVLFILKAGPYANGGAYKLAYTNRKITDSIYRTEPTQVRSAINSAIISNTMNNAIKTKNITQALAAANIARSTNRSNYQRSQQLYAYNMINYYRAVSDTSNYFREATKYYDTYYLTLSADSIQKLEARNKRVMLESQKRLVQKSTSTVSKQKMDSITAANPNITVRKETMMLSASGTSYGSALNNVAWAFYKTGTKNITHLSTAMIWSRRSIELTSFYGYYNTLAHILYAMGYEEEAIKTQEDGISMAKNKKGSFTMMEEELIKMKSRTL